MITILWIATCLMTLTAFILILCLCRSARDGDRAARLNWDEYRRAVEERNAEQRTRIAEYLAHRKPTDV